MSIYPMRDAARTVIAKVLFYSGRPHESSATSGLTSTSGALKSFNIQSAIDDGNGIAVGSYVVPIAEVVVDKNYINSADWANIKAASWLVIQGGYYDGTNHYAVQGSFCIKSVTLDSTTNKATIECTAVSDDMTAYTADLLNVYGTELIRTLVQNNLTWHPSAPSYDDYGDIDWSSKRLSRSGETTVAKAYYGSAKDILCGIYGALGGNVVAGGFLDSVNQYNFIGVGYHDSTASVSLTSDMVYDDTLDIQDEVTLAGIMKDSGEVYGSAPYLRTHGFFMDNGEFDGNLGGQIIQLQYCPGSIKWRGDMTSPLYLGNIIMVNGKRFIVCSKEQVFSDGGYYEVITSTAPVNVNEQNSRDYGYNDVRAQGYSIVPTVSKVKLSAVNVTEMATWNHAYVKTLGSIKEVTLHIAVKLPSGRTGTSWVDLLSLDSSLTPNDANGEDVYFLIGNRNGGAKYPILCGVWNGTVKAILNGNYDSGVLYEGSVTYVVGIGA